jgi:spore coat polysaccharide biosynthesis predicted glycosyltransferase SpsG
MTQTILIRCDLFKGSGAGHLKRCSIIAHALKKLNFSPVFVLDKQSDVIPIDISYPIEYLGSRFEEKTDALAVLRLAEKYNSPAVIADSYRITEKWISTLRSAKFLVVLIDDLGIGSDASLRVDYSPAASRIDGSALQLLGPSYFITDSPVLPSRRCKARKMILHAGGTGNFAPAKEVYAKSVEIANERDIGVTWLCPNELASNWVQKSGLQTSSHVVVGWQKGRNDLWSNFDIVVGPASTSLYEAIMQGCLGISFPISATQTSSRENWVPIGHTLHFTSSEVENPEIASAILLLAVDHFDKLRAALDEFAVSINGNGAQKIASIIVSMINGKTPEITMPPIEPDIIRPCDIRDAGTFLNARNMPHVRALSTNPKHIINWPEHLRWWLESDTERFVVSSFGQPEAFFWHRPRTIRGRDYLIGGWFPAGDQPAFAAGIRLIDWQLTHCAKYFPDHTWLATINKQNRAVLALNRRYGFVNADVESLEAVEDLFPGTTDNFTVLQRKARIE